jgi:hypothetical protein
MDDKIVIQEPIDSLEIGNDTDDTHVTFVNIGPQITVNPPDTQQNNIEEDYEFVPIEDDEEEETERKSCRSSARNNNQKVQESTFNSADSYAAVNGAESANDDTMLDTDSDDDDFLEAKSCRECPCCYTRSICYCIYIGLLILIIASLTSIIILTILIVLPYEKVSMFKQGRCRAADVVIKDTEASCACGQNCHSSHHCIQLLVEYVPSTSNFSSPELTEAYVLYENEAYLDQQVGLHVCIVFILINIISISPQ